MSVILKSQLTSLLQEHLPLITAQEHCDLLPQWLYAQDD